LTRLPRKSAAQARDNLQQFSGFNRLAYVHLVTHRESLCAVLDSRVGRQRQGGYFAGSALFSVANAAYEFIAVDSGHCHIKNQDFRKKAIQ
jgi:hypothetical protein